VDESGALLAPWPVDGAGRVMTASATLMEREPPYQLQVELARGKINQLRCQASDWRSGGLQMAPEFAERIHEVSRSFGRAATAGASPEALTQAQQTLVNGYRLGEDLVRLYIEQVFGVRHQRQPKLDTGLNCRLTEVPTGPGEQIAQTCNGIYLPLAWKDTEPS